MIWGGMANDRIKAVYGDPYAISRGDPLPQ